MPRFDSEGTGADPGVRTPREHQCPDSSGSLLRSPCALRKYQTGQRPVCTGFLQLEARSVLPAAMPGETGGSVTQGTNMKEERKQEQEAAETEWEGRPAHSGWERQLRKGGESALESRSEL